MTTPGVRRSGVPCPACGAMNSAVIDSRVHRAGAARYRRRRCGTCGERFTTREALAGSRVAPIDIVRIKARVDVALRTVQELADIVAELQAAG